MPPASRIRFERAFGADFSDVRMHADAPAARAADELDAEAWTSGRDIVFAAGRYAPGTPVGDRLLAHELTHVLQQRTAHPSGHWDGDNPSAEAQAERAAERMMTGAPVGAVPAAPRSIARQARSGGVARVEINCRDQTMHFDGPQAHTWQLTSCDLSDGDYTATVRKSLPNGRKLVQFRIAGAQEGTRFSFEYRVAGSELDPYDSVTDHQSVHIHAVSSGSAADPALGEDQRWTSFHVAVLDVPTFERSTGTSASALPEGRIVDGAGLQFRQVVPGLGMGALRARYPFPSNTTGVLWTGQHMADVAVLGGVPTVRGFRAGATTHLRSFAEMELGLFGGSAGEATYALNFGTAGTYAEDYAYLYSPGARLVHRGPLDPGVAEEGANLINAAAGRYNQTYRYSPPPPGTPAFERLAGGNPNYVCRPGQNCINVPLEEHVAMLGGRRMTVNPSDPVDIATGNTVATNEPFVFTTPEGRSYSGPGYARNARTWASSEAELAAQGLTSTPITAGMYARAVLKIGGKILIIYGVFSSAARIVDARGDERLAVAAEETGSWLGGWVGAAISSAIGGAVVCSETGLGAVICSGAFGIAGGLTGSVIGADEARAGGEAMQRVLDLLGNPAALQEGAMQMFGTDEQRRQYYEMRDVLESIF